MHPFVPPFTLSDMNIFKTSCEADHNQFSSKASLGWRLAAFGFGPDRIRTLVSMATDSSHRVIMGKSCEHSSSSIFHGIFLILAGNKESNKSLDGFKIQQDWTRVCGVSYPLASEKISIDF